MHTCKTRALALRSFSQGESNRIVDLLCEELGLVRAVAHGARKTTSRFGGSLEPGTLVWTVLVSSGRSTLYTLKEARLESSFQALKQDLSHLEALFGFLERLTRSLPAHEADAGRFAEVLELLSAVEQGRLDVQAFSLLGSLLGLSWAGLLPEWGVCSECGAETGACRIGFNGVYCPRCRPPAAERVLDLSASATRILQRITSRGVGACANLTISEGQLREIGAALDLIAAQVGGTATMLQSGQSRL